MGRGPSTDDGGRSPVNGQLAEVRHHHGREAARGQMPLRLNRYALPTSPIGNESVVIIF